MKHLSSIFLALLISISAAATDGEKKFDFDFYGMVKADVFYNSRASVEAADGLFYLFPKAPALDADGHDLNADAHGSLYLLLTRVGVDIKGPKIGSATTSAKIEADFRGSGSTFSVLRIRHAYFQLDWTRASLLVGQTWHPLFGDVSPKMINISTGAPFQPFSRCPQIRFRYYTPVGAFFTLAASWQMQYLATGPIGKSESYLKDSGIPEMFASINYRRGGFLVGAGAEAMSLTPRTKSVVESSTYKVSERVTSLSGSFYAKYTTNKWTLSGKTMLASNLTQAQMLGGYGVTSIDARTGECKYTPFRHSATWLNFVYGKKWQPGIFVGYMKNLGTDKPLVGDTYGVGLDIDQLLGVNAHLSYIVPCWRIGCEFSTSTAWYGEMDMSNGRIHGAKPTTCYRIMATAAFIF